MPDADGRSFPREVLEHYRYRAIQLHTEGRPINDIAHFFGVHRGSVSRWITIKKRNGKKALQSKKALGPAFKLTSEEMQEMIRLLRENAITHGFETPLWTCKRLQQTIQDHTGKKLHSTNIMRWLKRWGFTNQKPERRAMQRDDEAVKRWLKEEWPKIREHQRRWQAMLYFQDESGVSLTAVLGKTWAPKGQTPLVRVTGNRGGLCITSAISPAGHMVFRIEKGKVKAEQHVEFLGQILAQHPSRKIIVIEDQAPVHKAKLVDRFVEQQKTRFALYRIPSYAPDLNPDEHVWEYLKAHQLKTHQAKNTHELRKLVKRKMQSIQRQKNLIQSFFAGTFVT